MNTKQACAVRRKPVLQLRKLSGLRFGGSGIHQRRFPAKNRRRYLLCAPPLKKEKTIALSAAGTKYAPALLSYICTAEKRVIVAGSQQYPPECGRAGGLLRLFVSDALKKTVKGKRAKAAGSPMVCALHPWDSAALFPCHSGAFLLCPFFLWTSTAFGWVSSPPKRFGGFCLIGTGK